MKKRIISIILVLCMFVSLLPMAALADNFGSQPNADYTLEVGKTVQFKSSGKATSFKTSDAGVATVDGNGVITGVAPGTVTITMTSYVHKLLLVKWGKTTAKLTLAVVENEGEDELALNVGGTATVPMTGSGVKYSSSLTNVATVSSDGLVTGIGEGTATITATNTFSVGGDTGKLLINKFLTWFRGIFGTNVKATVVARETYQVEVNDPWNSPEAGTASGTDNSVDIYSITGLSINRDNMTLTAVVSAIDNCAMVVRFIEEEVYFSDDYPENKEYINSGYTYASHVVPANCSMEQVSASITGSLPRYFVAEAVLIDSDGNELCNSYSSIECTERYEQYKEKSIYDFPEDNVLQFGTETDKNFGVLADDVDCYVAEKVTRDYDNSLYYIDGFESEIKPGDKVFITAGNEDFLFKALTVIKENGTTIVKTAKADDEEYGFYLEDFYKYIKVDIGDDETSTEKNQMSDAPKRLLKGIDVAAVNVDETNSVDFKLPLDFKTKHFEVSGEAGVGLSLNVVLEWDIVLFGEDYMKCKFEKESDIKGEFEVKGKADNDDDSEEESIKKTISIGKIRIPIAVTGLDAFADPKAEFSIEVSGGLHAVWTEKIISGFDYNTIDGKHEIEDKSRSWSVEVRGNLEGGFGITPEIGVEFLDGVLKASLEAFAGVKFEAEAVVPVFHGGDTRHACNLCIEGELFGEISVEAGLSFHLSKKLSGKPLSGTLLEAKISLFEFYSSLINPKTSMFKGKVKFGKGSCPNQDYKVSVVAKNEDGTEANVNVAIYDKYTNTLLQKLDSGNSLYLFEGNYVAKATVEGNSCEKSFSVVDGPKSVTLKADASDGKINGNVIDAQNSNAIADAVINVYEYTTNVATTKSDSSGKYVVSLPEGTYKVEISAENYVSAVQYVTIRDGENKYMDSMLMAKKDNKSIMGGVYGTIKDAITGMTVSGVTVTVSHSFDNSDVTNTYVKRVTTNTQGVYDCKKWSVFGVDFGLEAGNYTVTISKEGYISTSFNVTIVGGTNMEFNSTITPVGAENVYKIVLTWGARPSDLDSHFNGVVAGSRDHVYYSRKNGTGAELDTDDTSSYGPETITIPNVQMYEGKIYYSVHDYSNRGSSASTALSSSTATVKVFKGGELLETFYVPTGIAGTVWNVFYIDEAKNIVPVNSFGNVYDPSSVYGSTV